MSPICAYCGSPEGTTRDHVPPKVCFPEPRPANLITVPACFACNNGRSAADEEFASFLSLRVGLDSPITSQLHQKNKRIVSHNKKLRRVILENTEKVMIETSIGVAEEKYLFKWSAKKHNEMIQRIIRGLYFHVYGKPLPVGVPVRGSMSKPFLDEPYRLWSSFPGKNIGCNGEFRFRHAHAVEDPKFSLWFMIFHDRHFASGSTGFSE